jgi:S-formylglutathione hydrolase FrmB
MGGSGAFHFGFKYPEMFSMIYGMCAGVSDPNAATRGRARTAYELANMYGPPSDCKGKVGG